MNTGVDKEALSNHAKLMLEDIGEHNVHEICGLVLFLP